MDLSSIIGIVAAFAVVTIAILLGGNIAQFIDLPSILIVLGGGFAATLVRFPLAGIGSAFIVGSKAAFTHKKVNPRDLIEDITSLADTVRKSGPLGLENVEVSDASLAKGIQYIADGYEGAFIKDAMERERDLYLERLQEGKKVFKALGESAPAFGMIGTLVGLVQMLATMDDPSTIGPSMAIALLTTLYGALVANVICLPIVDKLDSKFDIEEVNQTLVIDGVMQIRENKSPALIRDMLIAYVPEKARAEFAEAA
ncbi:MotA/TolQ/ExbB proton channel family protein [Stappia taiwanensis]|uniref:MotA/TolQ/ExbB proton channel family protein n=1 Tax=Stappia taiwanensis TaxID=992267 RepID=A0A838XUS2_9HYPH|nr:MotA/TolQ/ExbB proton channel family protein [Stappia taiwanensis]MBA4612358.1 MotA/TolQ/ExbB proton channel family protein [Stappia taiwanensis]GGF04768.1 flagellar motor protein PomA [Stappia taiwanensis]